MRKSLPIAIAAILLMLLAGCPPETQRPGSNDQTNDDERCVELVELWATGAEPAAVSLYFEAVDCETEEPVDHLTADQFEIAEQGAIIGGTTPVESVSTGAVRTYAAALIDVSDGVSEDLVAGAERLVERFVAESVVRRAHLGIYLFDGSGDVRVWQPPIDDADILHRRLDELDDYTPEQTGARNLHGAVANSIELLGDHQRTVYDRNAGGVIPTGELLVITGGEDTAGDVDAQEAVSAVDGARSSKGDDTPPIRTRFATTDDARDSLADTFGNTARVSSSDPAAMADHLQGVVDEIAVGRDGRYLVGFCSTLRSDGSEVMVAVGDMETRPAEFTVDAGEFDDRCGAETLLGDDCAERDCGGFLCGGCSDTDEICDAETGACIYYCLDAVVCEDEDITTDLGFEMNCFMGPTVTECGGQCVDTGIDDDHCGTCDNTCSAATSECVDGACICEGGDRDCGGDCVDLATDDDHCGECDNACPDGIECVDGECPCEGAEIACSGACVDVWVNDDHCGECDNACEDGRSCADGQCVCDEPTEQCDGACVDTSANDDHCGTCDNPCDTDQTCNGGECVCTGDDESNCDGTCVTTVDNDDHCGECDNACGGDQFCDGDTCACDDTELTACGNACVDTTDNDDHCGECDNACGDDQFCDATSCEPVPLFDEKSVHAGIDHTCGLRTDGTAVCWGLDDYDQATALDVTFVSISPGDRYTCGVDTTEAALCWGRNLAGESDAPVDKAFVDVAAGWSHTCGIETDESLHCWGSSAEGKTAPPSDDAYRQVSVGLNHSCALSVDGEPVCWGDDSDGKTATPAGDFVELSAGMNHTCALDTDGGVDCWGDDGWDQLQVPDGTFIDVAAGGSHSCAIDTDGEIICWGLDNEGQGESGVPGGQFVGISAGFQYTCAVGVDDDVVCWGNNDDGQGDFPGW